MLSKYEIEEEPKVNYGSELISRINQQAETISINIAPTSREPMRAITAEPFWYSEDIPF